MKLNNRVVVGISGGVDSAVAASLLKSQGHDVVGLFMKNWEEDDNEASCSSYEDYTMAKAACEAIGIPLETVNFSYEYWENVFAIFLREYKSGNTPNPDVLCNKEIKFKEFLEFAKTLGASNIATGHYARVEQVGGKTFLYKAYDKNKDQSYFLHTLDQDALKSTIFPLAKINKTKVRQIALELQLPNASRKDSTGICFIGEKKFNDFLAKYLPGNPGEIRTADGNYIGKHKGLWFYTIGQRHGLDIGGPGEPWYVVEKKVSENILIVAQGHENPALMKKSLVVTNMHWINKAPKQWPFKCLSKTRYRQADQKCSVYKNSDNTYNIIFDQPQRAPTPGQSLVLYSDEQVLGGGIIFETLTNS